MQAFLYKNGVYIRVIYILKLLNWKFYTKTEKVHLRQFEQEWMYNNDIIET